MAAQMSRDQLIADLAQGHIPGAQKDGEMRIVRVRVPGKEIDLAHVIGVSSEDIYRNLGLTIGTHEGEDHTGEAIGIMRFTPWKACIIGADIAVKSGDVELGFVDRFNGSLILTGSLSEVTSSINEVLDYFRSRLDFNVCHLSRE